MVYQEFIEYLTNGKVPADKWAVRRQKRCSAHYVLMDNKLHRVTDSKVRKLGFFWPTMNTDCESYARQCDKCQSHSPSIHSPTELLRTSTAPYPFMRWGMDIIVLIPNSRRCRFVPVLTDYFTKWIEADAFAQITDKEEFCNKWNIRLSPSTLRYPQGNGQAESSNKIIIDDELDGVLWSHRTTPRGATKSTPFSLAYGMEAVALAEVNVTSLRRSKMPQYVEPNRDMLLDALDELEEKRDQVLLRIQNYHNQIESYYSKKVRVRPLELDDLVLRKVFKNTKELNAGKLGANWEGPYKITRVVKPGVYRLETSRGEAVPRAWNSMHLHRF
ncbi:hypothetical protein Bca101_026095 [Brassica carinata]